MYTGRQQLEPSYPDYWHMILAQRGPENRQDGVILPLGEFSLLATQVAAHSDHPLVHGLVTALEAVCNENAIRKGDGVIGLPGELVAMLVAEAFQPEEASQEPGKVIPLFPAELQADAVSNVS